MMGDNGECKPMQHTAHKVAKTAEVNLDPLRTELRAIAECIADVRNERRVSTPTPFGVHGGDSAIDALVGKLANKFALYGAELRSFVAMSSSPACALCSVKGRPLHDSHCEACRVVKGLAHE